MRALISEDRPEFTVTRVAMVGVGLVLFALAAWTILPAPDAAVAPARANEREDVVHPVPHLDDAVSDGVRVAAKPAAATAEPIVDATRSDVVRASIVVIDGTGAESAPDRGLVTWVAWAGDRVWSPRPRRSSRTDRSSSRCRPAWTG